MNLIRSNLSAGDSLNEQEDVEKEAQLWNLIQLIYKDRNEHQNDHDMEIMEDENDQVFKNEAKLVQKLTKNNSLFRRLKKVMMKSKKNLDKIQDKISSFTQKYCWEHTLHQLNSKERKLHLNIRDYVTELDPDAPIRQRKALHDLDQEDEHLILEYFYTFIRAGDFDSLKSLTQKLGHSWRAATFDGFKYYDDLNYSHLNDLKSSDQIRQNRGNMNRDIWKLVVGKMVSNVR